MKRIIPEKEQGNYPWNYRNLQVTRDTMFLKHVSQIKDRSRIDDVQNHHALGQKPSKSISRVFS
jgi:hypothetical protein